MNGLLLRLFYTGVICMAALSLCGKKASGTPGRIACAAIAVISVSSVFNVIKIDIVPFEADRTSVEALVNEAMSAQKNDIYSETAKKVEDYIKTLGRERGFECSPGVSWENDGGTYKISEITVHGVPGWERQEFEAVIRDSFAPGKIVFGE